MRLIGPISGYSTQSGHRTLVTITSLPSLTEQDIREFRKHLQSLRKGIPYSPETARFSQNLADTGSSLADQSVTSVNTAAR